MTRTDRPDAADPPGNSKGGAPSGAREPMAGLLASSPSKAIAANEFDPREAFYPKTLLTAEDLRGGAPAAKAAAGAATGPATPTYVADPALERRSPMLFVIVLMLLAGVGGGAYWYFMEMKREPAPSAAAPATASPNTRSGTIAPVVPPAPGVASPAPTAASRPAPTPVPATPAANTPAAHGVTHTKGGAAPVEPVRPPEPGRPRPPEAPAAASPAGPAKGEAKSCPPQVAALGLCNP